MAAAQERAEDVHAFHARVVGQVGESQVKRWLEMPDWTVRDVSRIAHSYDPAQMLTPQAIEAAILHRRAQARARALRDLLDTDLNGDGAVSRGEVARIALALDGRARGLLWLRHRRADGDGDGHVNAHELRVYADHRAQQHLGARPAQAMRNLLLLDLDDDGAVSVREAEEALVMLAKGGSAPRVGDRKTAL